jgi:hypothetical protein
MTGPAATGKGLRIAVIDSGVNLNHAHIVARTHPVILPTQDPDETAEDKLGHGTAVMAAVQQKAPDAEYFAIKLFGPTLRTSTARLLDALEWAIGRGMDIINLSLGTPNLDYRPHFEAMLARAARAGTIIVSARTAGQQLSLPGSLDGVISVEADPTLDRESYRPHPAGESNVFWASGFPRPLPGMPQERNLQGISFAVANMTGFVARAVEGLGAPRSCDTVCAALRAEAPRL